MNREDELTLLIEEQKRDDDHYQRPEMHTVPFGNLLEVMDDNGRLRELVRKEWEQGCTLHGTLSLRPDPTRGAPVCRVCDRERKKRDRRTNGEWMRAQDRARYPLRKRKAEREKARAR